MKQLAVPMGVYIPGRTLIHRLSPGVKLLGGFLFIAGISIWVRTLPAAGLIIFLLTAGYLLAHIPLPVAWSQLWPPLPIIGVVGVLQWWQRGPEAALLTVIVLLCSIMTASLLTLTTTIGELLDSIDRALAPLRRFGLPIEKISLALALTIRLIPLQLATVAEVIQARKARGVGLSLAAFGTPILVRSLRRAAAIAEALAARGVGEEN